MKKIEITKEAIIDARNNCENYEEICKKLNVTYGVLYKRCKEYEITLKRPLKWQINVNEFIIEYNKGLNDKQLSEIFNIPQKRICDIRKKLGLKCNTQKELQFTDEQLQIFLGGLLGDSCLYIPNDCKNAMFIFKHSLVQEKYCLWKYNKLKNLCFKPIYSSQFDKRTNKTYYGITIKSFTNSLFTPYNDLFYKINKNSKCRTKYINPQILSKVNDLGLAIWFQDDGFKSKSGYLISTNCYSLEDWEQIASFFLYKYNIIVKRLKSGVTYIPSKYVEKFNSIIEPYIHPDCLYKLHNGRCKTPLNRETPEMDNPVLN